MSVIDHSGVPRLGVEVYSDIVCPWCYIGKRRFDRAVAELAGDPVAPVGVDVVYRPFQLDPGAPRDRPAPAAEFYARRFGGAGRAAEMIERVRTIGAADGLEIRLDRAVRASTTDAHRLLCWALTTAGSAAQAELEDALMTAYFRDGADVGDEGVLVQIATRCGLDAGGAPDLLRSEGGLEDLAVGLQRAADHGITAVPTYVVERTWSIPGAQDTDVFFQTLRRLAARRSP